MRKISEFTAAEAAFVLREPVKSVKKALDHAPFEVKLVQRAGGAVRSVDWRDLLYLYVTRSLRDDLTPKARREIYPAFKRMRRDGIGKVELGRLSVSIADMQAEIEKRTQELANLATNVEIKADRDPLLRGTDIEVHRIAALLDGGMSVEQICEDFPSLTKDMVLIAAAYAAAHPKPGRPYPATTVKRALQGANLEALDEFMGERR